MFRFVKTVHKYSAGPEGKIGLLYVKLFAYMAGGEGMGVRGFKMFCKRGSEFFLLALCKCVVGSGSGPSLP